MGGWGIPKDNHGGRAHSIMNRRIYFRFTSFGGKAYFVICVGKLKNIFRYTKG